MIAEQKSGPVVRTKKKYRARWSNSEGSYIAPIHVEGLAAKIEDGGRLERHVVFGKAVRAGLVVHRRSALNRIVDEEWGGILVKVEDSFGRFVEKTL